MGETRFDIPPPPHHVAAGKALGGSLAARSAYTFASVVAGGDFSIRLQDASVIRPIQALSDVYFEAIPRIMDAPATSGA